MIDIQISATPSGVNSFVKINGQKIPDLYKLTLVVEAGKETQLILEGHERDEAGHFQVDATGEGLKSRTLAYFGGSVEILGAAKLELR